MSDDLKTMLDQLAKSKGQKRLHFAYGTGKRKDGKGDGALHVAGKAFKKETLEKECECSQFYDGFCWSSEDGQTIYFGGKKKLGAPLIAKMMLTAKKTTNKQFEFAIPTPEEESRVQALAESGDGESEAEEDGKADPAKQTYEGLRSSILPDLAYLLKSDPTTAATIQHIVAAAAEHAGKGEYPKAVTFLEKAGTALATATKTARQTEGKTEVPHGKVGLEVLRHELHTLRTQAIGGIAKLSAKLAHTPHPQAPQVAQIVKKLAQDLPGELETVLQELDKAVQANDTAGVTAGRARVQKCTTEWLGFLQTNKDYIHGCETNPYGIEIHIDKPIRAALTAILKTAQ